MATLTIPAKDIETLLRSSEIGEDEFKNVIDKVNPNTIYTNADFASGEVFSGNLSNGIAISDLLGVLGRAVNSAATYSYSADKLGDEVRQSIIEAGYKPDADALNSLSEKIKIAYEKFFNSGLALDALTSGGNLLTGVKIEENIKPVFDQSDELKGYVFQFTLAVSYANDDESKRFFVNLDHLDAEYLLYSIDTALSRKGKLISKYRERGENVFTTREEDEFYDIEK